MYGDGFPTELAIDEAFIRRGHSASISLLAVSWKGGAGNGVVGQFGMVAIANLMDERIPHSRTVRFIHYRQRQEHHGRLRPNISVDDRWAIVAYLRALQKSQNMKLATCRR
jgi:hypothetical protein